MLLISLLSLSFFFSPLLKKLLLEFIVCIMQLMLILIMCLICSDLSFNSLTGGIPDSFQNLSLSEMYVNSFLELQ